MLENVNLSRKLEAESKLPVKDDDNTFEIADISFAKAEIKQTEDLIAMYEEYNKFEIYKSRLEITTDGKKRQEY